MNYPDKYLPCLFVVTLIYLINLSFHFVEILPNCFGKFKMWTIPHCIVYSLLTNVIPYEISCCNPRPNCCNCIPHCIVYFPVTHVITKFSGCKFQNTNNKIFFPKLKFRTWSPFYVFPFLTISNSPHGHNCVYFL